MIGIENKSQETKILLENTGEGRYDLFDEISSNKLLSFESNNLVTPATAILLRRAMSIAKPDQEIMTDVVMMNGDFAKMVFRIREIEEEEVFGERKETIKIQGSKVARQLEELNDSVIWNSIHLNNGAQLFRSQVGAEFKYIAPEMPNVPDPDVYLSSDIQAEVTRLNWRKDPQLLDIYDNVKNDYKSSFHLYLREHPEISQLTSDFMQALLFNQPDDVLKFAAQFFGLFSKTVIVPGEVENTKI
ncbi:hypothetical protein Ciccas_009803 [Cichlidogyrus casuarinus]|uniref:Ciliogenesis-associated TTC17-interacting protein n=1 Tax=Cichlidogyrus casuarinus TaxID=1844966 RepID=A0ABD2Q0H4_9PLAT